MSHDVPIPEQGSQKFLADDFKSSTSELTPFFQHALIHGIPSEICSNRTCRMDQTSSLFSGSYSETRTQLMRLLRQALPKFLAATSVEHSVDL